MKKLLYISILLIISFSAYHLDGSHTAPTIHQRLLREEIARHNDQATMHARELEAQQAREARRREQESKAFEQKQKALNETNVTLFTENTNAVLSQLLTAQSDYDKGDSKHGDELLTVVSKQLNMSVSQLKNILHVLEKPTEEQSNIVRYFLQAYTHHPEEEAFVHLFISLFDHLTIDEILILLEDKVGLTPELSAILLEQFLSSYADSTSEMKKVQGKTMINVSAVLLKIMTNNFENFLTKQYTIGHNDQIKIVTGADLLHSLQEHMLIIAEVPPTNKPLDQTTPEEKIFINMINFTPAFVTTLRQARPENQALIAHALLEWVLNCPVTGTPYEKTLFFNLRGLTINYLPDDVATLSLWLTILQSNFNQEFLKKYINAVKKENSHWSYYQAIKTINDIKTKKADAHNLANLVRGLLTTVTSSNVSASDVSKILQVLTPENLQVFIENDPDAIKILDHFQHFVQQHTQFPRNGIDQNSLTAEERLFFTMTTSTHKFVTAFAHAQPKQRIMLANALEHWIIHCNVMGTAYEKTLFNELGNFDQTLLPNTAKILRNWLEIFKREANQKRMLSILKKYMATLVDETTQFTDLRDGIITLEALRQRKENGVDLDALTTIQSKFLEAAAQNNVLETLSEQDSNVILTVLQSMVKNNNPNQLKLIKKLRSATVKAIKNVEKNDHNTPDHEDQLKTLNTLLKNIDNLVPPSGWQRLTDAF